MWPMLVSLMLQAPPVPRAAPVVRPGRQGRVAEADPLRFFEGAWRCEAKGTVAPGGEMDDTRVTLTVRAQLGRAWLVVSRTSIKGHGGSASSHDSQTFWRHDKAAGQFVAMGVGDKGDYFTASSAGFFGEDFIWGGSLATPDGQKAIFRTVLTRVGANAFVERNEWNSANVWHPQGAPLLCKRGSGDAPATSSAPSKAK